MHTGTSGTNSIVSPFLFFVFNNVHFILTKFEFLIKKKKKKKQNKKVFSPRGKENVGQIAVKLSQIFKPFLQYREKKNT